MIIKVIGGGLAGCEAAYQLLKRGFKVDMYEMRPHNSTGAHKTDNLAELVCSNSLKSDRPDTASGLLKAEMRALDSIVLNASETAKVQAGSALAVNRELFSASIEKILGSYKGFRLIREEVKELPGEPAVIATGPLTSNSLAEKLKALVGDYLYFSDAAAPIVSAESIDKNRAFFASRYNKGGADYLNCGMTKEEYLVFYNELINAKCVTDKLLEPNFFEGCMPVEVMAKRGVDALRYGPLRPVGIVGPDNERYYAVLQLRKEDTEGSSYNLVGFQTNLTFAEQKRVFGQIPALRNAEYYRYGVMHRNTFIDSPALLDNTFKLKTTDIYIAGQLSGVEGYIESAMSGMVSGIALAMRLSKINPYLPDKNTMMGALIRYISNEGVINFQPMNSNFGLLPPPSVTIKDKAERKAYFYNRAIKSIEEYAKSEQGERYGNNA